VRVNTRITPSLGARQLSLWPFVGSSTPTQSDPSTPLASSNVSPDDPSSVAAADAASASASLPPTTETTTTDAANSLDAAPEAVTSAVAEHVPTLAELGLGKGIFVGTAQKLLVGVHEFAPSLPWWATIVVTVVGVRTLLVPVVVRGLRLTANMAIANPQLKEIMEVCKCSPLSFPLNIAEVSAPHAQFLSNHQQKAKKAKEAGNIQQMHIFQASAQKFMKENNVKPIQALVMPLMQMFIFIPFFLGVRGLAEAHYPGLSTGGFGWVTDLTKPDPLWILPISSALSTFSVVQVRAALSSSSYSAF
jgi:YidC/Oxa1 family membrane protein insertase